MRYESELVKPIKVHGGKFYLASSIVKLFPERCACPNSPSPSDPGYIHYVEPYAGGLSVLLNNEPEGISEVVNDLNHEITNFWRVLQDETLFSEFIRKVEAVPFSEVEYGSSVRFGYEETKANPVAAAVSLFIRSRQSLAGRMKRFTGVTRSRTRRGMNAECSAWLSAVEGLPEVHARLKRILVFNRDALDVIRSEDGVRTLYYCLHPWSKVRMADEKIIPIQDVVVGSKLFGGKTVTHAVSHEHKGDMLTVKVQGLPDDIRVTPEHVMVRIPKRTHKRQETRSDAQLWAAREEVRAESLQDGDYMLIPIGGDEKPVAWDWRDDAAPRGIRKKVAFKPCRQLFRLLGYYAAEGHIQRDGVHENGAILSFGTHEAETWVKDAAECCQAAFGFNPSVRPGPHDSVRQVFMLSRSVAEFVSRYVTGTATNKFLHRDLMTAPLEEQRELLLGWLHGDGGIELSSRGRVKLLGTSSSETLARQMFQISLRLGLRPSFKVRAGRIFDVYFSAVDAVTLGYIQQPKRICTTRRLINGHVLARVKSVTRYPYSGPVCDITVDGDSLFAAPFALVHNCDPPYLHSTRATTTEYGEYEMTEGQHKELLDTLVGIRGRFLLSGYRSDLYDEYESKHGWRSVEFHVANSAAGGSNKRIMTEVVWMNYQPDESEEQSEEQEEEQEEQGEDL